jgi:hypothetical protein
VRVEVKEKRYGKRLKKIKDVLVVTEPALV